MKRVLYLGYVIAPDNAEEYQGVSIAGNKMQWNIVKNLAKNDDVEITCVTIAPHAAFPHEGTIWNSKKIAELLPGVRSYEISFCNLPVIKQFWQVFSVYHTAMRLMKKREYDVIFCFNLFPQIGIPARWLKKRYSGIDTVCLLADLPIDDNTMRRSLSRILRGWFEQSTWKSMRNCNRYIVLNKHVIEKYLPGKNYIVVDGGVDEDDVAKYPKKKYAQPAEYNVLFCGALTEYNGIPNLLRAMELVKSSDIVLDIYGGGYLESTVREAERQNSRIRYHGVVSNDEVLLKQRRAWLLINPRATDDPISCVTFPSKTFEYLLSGTPVLSTRLNGYGKEYDECMFWIEEDTAEKIAECLDRIRHMERADLEKKANDARCMVVSKKLWKEQSKRIVSYLLEE